MNREFSRRAAPPQRRHRYRNPYPTRDQIEYLNYHGGGYAEAADLGPRGRFAPTYPSWTTRHIGEDEAVVAATTTQEPGVLEGEGEDLPPPPEAEAEAEGYAEDDLGRELLGAFGVETQRGRPLDERDLPPDYDYGPDPRWPSERVERRELVSDWVQSRDPRRERGGAEWTGEQSYLVDFDRDQDRPFDDGRVSQNLDGLFDLDDVNQNELRRAMENSVVSMNIRGSGAAPGGIGGGERLPPAAAEALLRRFNAAGRRARDIEQEASGRDVTLAPSLSAARCAADRSRVARVFQPATRLRDQQRAMTFYASDGGGMKALTAAGGAADAAGRRQFGDYARDLLARVRATMARERHGTPLKSGVAKVQSRGAAAWGPPIGAMAGAVGRIMPAHSLHRALGPGAASRPRAIHPLDVPVFSRAAWTVGGSQTDLAGSCKGELACIGADTASDAAPQQADSYFLMGNERFLAARMGMRTAVARAAAERDAIEFFRRRFGLDFTPDATHGGTAKRAADGSGALIHGSLPAVMQPYTVSAKLPARLRHAEGHLASADDAGRDPLRNGMRLYTSPDDAARTVVAEAGWMVRGTAKDGLELPGASGGGDSGEEANSTQRAGLRLPRGGILATGFWVIERPAAPPALLRFQSSGPPQVIAKKLEDSKDGSGEGGVVQEIKSRWDVYDMAHDASQRPLKGVGRAASVLRIERRRNGDHRHEARTLVTIHH